MTDAPVWPKADPGDKESQKLLYEARLKYVEELAKAEQEQDLERLKSDDARIAADEGAARESIAAFHANLMEVSKAAIDRARAGAEAAQKAAAALGGAYTGVLALAFSVSERPLPSRGLVPTVLFGWAIVWATAYLAYLTTARGVAQPEPSTNFATGAMRRSNTFVLWIRNSVMNRKLALRVSVFALAFGLALLPAPFVNLDAPSRSAPTASTSPAWPAPPSTDSAVAKVRYEAEVKEVAELRAESKPIASGGNDWIWWALCGLGLLLSVAIPAVAELWGSAVSKAGKGQA